MKARPMLWIIGSGGMLGSAVNRLGSPAFDVHVAGTVRWAERTANKELASEAKRFVAATAHRTCAVAWCAGAGVIGTADDVLDAETRALETVLNELSGAHCTFFLSSSAGGVFGAGQKNPISEESDPNPISSYGRNKLRQEAIVREWATRTGARAVIGRISNLYGPGQSMAKQQGLISQACLATLTRKPVSIYVSLDTIRDYVYVDDAAAIILDLLAGAAEFGEGSSLIKIVASGDSVSIGGVLGEIRRVLGRAPNIVMTTSSRSAMQGSALSFRSVVVPEIDRRVRTPLPAGIAATIESIRRDLAASTEIVATSRIKDSR
ncbi:MAG: NAD-dependent epimerase/dehydratase family protein [Ilumatobacter sp.]|uniref:NAD-dependent epimerase/dehydratase family protein n=1 Tax=Ilumatobacter sp. TaxID=1967498 RepID=UPI003919A8FB